jgi:membrane protein required for colicin V production
MFVENIDLFAVDGVIAIVVFISFIVGWVRGATKEILSVVTWIGVIFLTIALFPFVQKFARGYIEHKLIADFATACGLFVIFLTLLSGFNYACANYIKNSALNVVDKVLGGVFGITRGVVFLAVIDIVVCRYFLTEIPKVVEESRLKPTISYVANVIFLMIPESWQNKLAEHMNHENKQDLLEFVDKLLFEALPTKRGVGDSNIEAVEASPLTESALQELPSEDSSRSKNKAGQSARELATLTPKRPDVSEDTRTPHALPQSAKSAMNLLLDSDNQSSGDS